MRSWKAIKKAGFGMLGNSFRRKGAAYLPLALMAAWAAARRAIGTR